MCTVALQQTCEGPNSSVCRTFQFATTNPPGTDDPPKESAALDGATQAIQLVNQDATSPIATIGGDHDKFEAFIDVRWDGFAAGEYQHVIAASGAFRLTVDAGANGPTLTANLYGTPGSTLTWPPPFTPGLQVGRWYRIVWGVSASAGHLLRVQPWHLTLGRYYMASEPESTCIWKIWSGNLADAGDVWFGHHPSLPDATRLAGRLDNVNLFNYVKVNPSMPTCLYQW
jgi:hypothetical protein